MENGYNCINEGTSTSTAPGPYLRALTPPCLIHSVNRKGKDYTYLYGKHVGGGSLTPYIDEAFDDRIEE